MLCCAFRCKTEARPWITHWFIHTFSSWHQLSLIPVRTGLIILKFQWPKTCEITSSSSTGLVILLSGIRESSVILFLELNSSHEDCNLYRGSGMWFPSVLCWNERTKGIFGRLGFPSHRGRGRTSCPLHYHWQRVFPPSQADKKGKSWKTLSSARIRQIQRLFKSWVKPSLGFKTFFSSGL